MLIRDADVQGQRVDVRVVGSRITEVFPRLTRTPGEDVVEHDVTISSPLNLPAEMPSHASELYARNVTELVELLGVSRTVVREALIFLEEDGFIRSRRGIGRFVAERLPVAGLERVEAPERLLVPEGGEVERTEIEVEDRA